MEVMGSMLQRYLQHLIRPWGERRRRPAVQEAVLPLNEALSTTYSTCQKPSSKQSGTGQPDLALLGIHRRHFQEWVGKRMRVG